MISRKYPIGIQTFSRIIRENYVYVDKTDLVWKMTKVSPFVFLSRPRRFGKSLLSSTLHSYFAGEKELFEGLKIMPLEQEWDALPLLYQSGYLTIKDYDRELKAYTLSIPNQEVRIGFTEGLLPTYIGLDSAQVQMGFAAKFWRALKQRDIDRAMREMQAYLAGIPYVEGFKKKLAEAATAEGFYEYTFYLIFNMLNVYARTQVKCFTGRIDMVVHMPNNTYVFELKTSATSGAALRQIDDRGYALPYQTGSDDVVKVGVKIDTATMTIKGWKVEC